MREVKGPGFVRFLYNQNPFYLISAAVILYGFRTATQESGFASSPWILASLFAAYTTLLALTAWLIVRFGRVWDDARSIFMVLLLLFMALSASLDGLFVSDAKTALGLAAAGFTFAVFVCEALVWSLGIRFRALFRFPLYSMFAVSFFYPYLFELQSSIWPELDRRFIILMFPFVVGATILSLIPAVRRSKQYAAKNGTPWSWPLYPYSLFFLAIVGLIGRAVMMGLSFDPSVSNGMLGTWMFVPIFIPVAWLIYEIGTAERNSDVVVTAMLLMPFSVVLAVPWPIFSNTDFYDQISLAVGSPVWLTMLVVVAMYFMAWIDGVEMSGGFLAFGLIGAAMMQQDGAMVQSFAEIQAWPLMVVAVWSVASTDRISRSSSWFLTACCASVPIGNSLNRWLVENVDTFSNLSGYEAVIAANFVLVASCLLVCIFSGRFAKQLKAVLAVVFPVVAVLSAVGTILASDHGMIAAGYACFLASLGVLIFLIVRSRLHLSAAAISMGASLLAAAPLMEYSIGNDQYRLVGFLGAGLSCFAMGLWVSAVKAGWTRKINSGFGKLRMEFFEAFSHDSEASVAERSLG